MTEKQERDQAAIWNGAAGRGWVDAQSLLDRLFQPFEELLLEPLVAGSASRVLDIGCGTGGTTIAALRRLGVDGRGTGVDISEPMIAAARERAEREGDSARASFHCADAQVHEFEPASFGAVISRFGVMFFSDPVGAFSNLRRATRPDGWLRFLAWRSVEENPFQVTAERAAAPLLPGLLPARDPNAPGQFGFADREKIQAVLDQSGWCEIEIRAVDVPCTMPESDLMVYLTRLGPVSRAVQELEDAEARRKVIETVRAAFDPFVNGGEVRFTAACWLVSAAQSGRGAGQRGL